MILLAVMNMTILFKLWGLASWAHISDDHRLLLTSTGWVHVFGSTVTQKSVGEHYMDITTRRRPMAVTSEQVRAVLDRDEPDYEEAASLGPDALPLLQRFVESGDPSLAPKAAYLAGRIGGPQSVPILELATASADSSVRAAAAHGARHLRPEQAEAVLLPLLDDGDPSVRKTALQAVPAAPSPALLAKLSILREVEPEPMVRELATELFDRASGGGR
jgi:hypothetical protein